MCHQTKDDDSYTFANVANIRQRITSGRNWENPISLPFHAIGKSLLLGIGVRKLSNFLFIGMNCSSKLGTVLTKAALKGVGGLDLVEQSLPEFGVGIPETYIVLVGF